MTCLIIAVEQARERASLGLMAVIDEGSKPPPLACGAQASGRASRGWTPAMFEKDHWAGVFMLLAVLGHAVSLLSM